MKSTILKIIFLTSSVIFFVVAPISVYAEEYFCEIMTVQGTVMVESNGSSHPAKIGDKVKGGDTVKVEAGSFADLAFDKEWKNVSRIHENSRVRIGTVQPTHLDMVRGDIFSRVKSLTKGSSFEVQTPTALAAVRGTEFRTIADVEGKTEIHNVSELPNSQVFVFGMDSLGNHLDSPLTLDIEKKTEVLKVGDTPGLPQQLSPEELAKGNQDNLDLKDKTPDLSHSPSGGTSRGGGVDDNKHEGDDEKKGFRDPGNGPGNGPGDAGGLDGPGSKFEDNHDLGKIQPPAFNPPVIPETIQNINDVMQKVTENMANTTQNVENQTIQKPPPPPDDRIKVIEPHPSPSP